MPQKLAVVLNFQSNVAQLPRNLPNLVLLQSMLQFNKKLQKKVQSSQESLQVGSFYSPVWDKAGRGKQVEFNYTERSWFHVCTENKRGSCDDPLLVAAFPWLSSAPSHVSLAAVAGLQSLGEWRPGRALSGVVGHDNK
ncbi:hypothetical protein VPH35_059653 [Triticum aestivum]